jgi:hypothetical protein
MSASPTTSPPTSRRGSVDLSGNAPRKFLNGWTKEQEELMAGWSDKAACYRWLHDRCEKKYSKLNMGITIPVIILSTLTGTANFALDGFIPADNQDMKKYAQATIGAVSIFAGILTTLGNFLRYAQGSESHRVAGIAWGKFQRQIAVELAIHPNERLDSMDFLKICRAELDRLIEQSPAIPDDVIQAFMIEFKEKKEITKPEVVGGLEHTRVFQDTNSRIKLLTGEAALMLMHKKKMLAQEITPNLDRMIRTAVDTKLNIVQNQIRDLSGVLLKTIKNPISSSTDSGTFEFTNPMKKVPSLAGFDWDSLSKKRFDTDMINAISSKVGTRPKSLDEATTSDIHIEVLGAPEKLRRNSTPETAEVVTPIDQRD